MARDLTGRRVFDQGRVELAAILASSNDAIIRELDAAERRWRATFTGAPVGMTTIAPDGQMIDANPAFCRLSGYTAGQLASMTVFDVLHPGEREPCEEMLRRAMAEPDLHHSLERRLVHADGSVVWAQVSSARIPDQPSEQGCILANWIDITDRKRFESELQHLADHDPLTGLWNRRRFEADVDRQAGNVARYGPSGALLMVDLDNFKQINDTLGHKAGDEMIVAVAEVLQGRLRASDIVARLGGDEFAIILPNVDSDQAAGVADALVRAVRDHIALLSGTRPQRVTASIGVVMFNTPGQSGDDMMANADLTMYDAKEAGRDRHAVYNSQRHSQPRTNARLAWVDRITAALAEDRFVLHAQPISDLRTGTIDRYELLLRMIGDSGELVGPATFLDIAEHVGLVGDIDRWVVERAIDIVSAGTGDQSPLKFEVNLSGRSIGDHNLLAFIESRILQSGIDPGRMVFEITETAAIANVRLARAFAQRLADIGCEFALDDFGAGIGSFYYLKHLPYDYIKIDGEFVADCLATQADRYVIRGIVTMARGLNKKTVAEFVQDEATLRFLAEEGVDYAQGYHVGRPQPLPGHRQSA